MTPPTSSRLGAYEWTSLPPTHSRWDGGRDTTEDDYSNGVPGGDNSGVDSERWRVEKEKGQGREIVA